MLMTLGYWASTKKPVIWIAKCVIVLFVLLEAEPIRFCYGVQFQGQVAGQFGNPLGGRSANLRGGS